MKIWASIGAAAALSLLASALGSAATAQPVTAGAAVFQQHCQSCHQPAIGRAPSRTALGYRRRDAVVQALSGGVMAPMAAGLSSADITAVATYLTPMEKVFGPGVPAAGVEVMCKSHSGIRAGASDWASLGVDAASSRFQPHPGLRAADVHRLKVKWSFAMPGGGQPTVVGDWLFITNRGGKF